MSREPNPTALEGILSSDEIEKVRAAADQFGGRDEERLERAREAFEN